MKNHRQVGTARSGLLISGTKDPKLTEDIETFKKTAPSIPSKFPSRSGRWKGEKNGFGGRTCRFKKEDGNFQPGPGYYHKSASLEKSSGSVSARGFTSMISKSNRFTSQQINLLNAATLPGPGSYTPIISTIPPVNPDAAPQSMFAKPRRYRDEGAPEPRAPVPGPGQYNLAPSTNREKIIDQRTGSSFFKDSSKRFRRAQPQTDHAPGSYNVGDAMDALTFYGKKDRKTNEHMPDAAFVSKSVRGAHMVTGKSVPGPGEYFPEKAEKIMKKGSGMEDKPMAWSAASKAVKSKKKQEAAGPTPGPGWYDLGGSEMINNASAASAFRSGTLRFKDRKSGKPPGPAYYNAKVPLRKKGFHLNVDNQWC